MQGGPLLQVLITDHIIKQKHKAKRGDVQAI